MIKNRRAWDMDVLVVNLSKACKTGLGFTANGVGKGTTQDYAHIMIFRRLAFLLTFISTLSIQQLQAAPALIQAGPMVGHVSDTEATIWVQVKQGASVSAVAHQGSKTFKHSETTDLDDGFFLLHFKGLTAGTPTDVTLSAERPKNASHNRLEAEETMSFRTALAPSATGRVRIAFGSCSKLSQYPTAPIYGAIADEKPDSVILLGDNAYFIVADGTDKHFSTSGPIGDWNSEEAMTARHLITRKNPDLQRMLRSMPNYGIWDDHDYGPNNADREFEMKEEALRAFKQMWANPGWGSTQTPGIYSKFRNGPVEVFLMDNRYYKYSPDRHKDVTVETGEIWGANQTEWLLENLKNSTAPVKLIANGTQILHSSNRGEGHFQEARGERQRLLDFLAKHKIGGVVIISGDRHFTEAMQLSQPDGTLLVEGTSSPLQQAQKVGYVARGHSTQLWSMRGNSYGIITVDVPRPDEGTVRFEVRDEENQVPVIYGEPRATTWTLAQLNYGKTAPTLPTWTPLFDGKTLNGWTQKNGTATYRIKDETIIGKTVEGSPNSFLCTDQEYSDFELMFDVQVDEGLNSGVQIRSSSRSDYKNGRVHGPQVEIESSPGESGFVYSEGTGAGWISEPRRTETFRNGAWNHYYIRALGSRIQTWINGVAVENLERDELPRSGLIGLQVHGIQKGEGPFEVKWQNIFVKDLSK